MKYFTRFWFPEVDSRIFGLYRILMGGLAFLTFWSLIPLAKFYYSDQGWFPLGLAVQLMSLKEWTLLHLITHPFFATVFLAFGCLFSLFLMIGYRSRTAAILTMIWLVSVQSRNWLNTYGGDAAIRIFVFYAILAPCGAAWSLDVLLKRKREYQSEIDSGNINFQTIPSIRAPLVSGWVLRLIQIQICLIYLHTGWAKSHGKDWLNGMGAAYALLDPIFARADFSQLLTIPFIKTMILATGHLTLWLELLFPLLMLWWPLRYLGLLGMGSIHLGIFVTLQVHLFSLILISSYVVFLPPKFFEKMEDWIYRLGQRVSGEKRLVLYDGECFVCRWAVFFLFSCDWFQRLEFYAIQEKGLWENKVPEDLHSKIDLDAPFAYSIKSGTWGRGFDAYSLIGKTLWCLRPLAAVVSRVGYLAKWGKKAYEPMAARRTDW